MFTPNSNFFHVIASQKHALSFLQLRLYSRSLCLLRDPLLFEPARLLALLSWFWKTAASNALSFFCTKKNRFWWVSEKRCSNWSHQKNIWNKRFHTLYPPLNGQKCVALILAKTGEGSRKKWFVHQQTVKSWAAGWDWGCPKLTRVQVSRTQRGHEKAKRVGSVSHPSLSRKAQIFIDGRLVAQQSLIALALNILMWYHGSTRLQLDCAMQLWTDRTPSWHDTLYDCFVGWLLARLLSIWLALCLSPIMYSMSQS